jgi:hypothetical protein
MSKSHPHSKRSSEEHPRDDTEVSADDLRAQVAVLAEQVRRLSDARGDRTTAERFDVVSVDAWVAGPDDPPAAEPPVPAAEPPIPAAEPPILAAPLPRVPTVAAAPPRAPAVGASTAAGAGATADDASGAGTLADRSMSLVASVVALAELAAIELRTSAELEAAALRGRSRQRLEEPTADYLLVLLERQRRMIAALAAQTERIEQAGAVIRAQILALEAEREHLDKLLASQRLEP